MPDPGQEQDVRQQHRVEAEREHDTPAHAAANERTRNSASSSTDAGGRPVQRLIDADETAGGDLVPSLQGFQVYVATNAEPMPLRVGNYVVSAAVGEGGMGAVDDALHEPTGKRAAVKLIRAAWRPSPARAIPH